MASQAPRRPRGQNPRSPPPRRGGGAGLGGNEGEADVTSPTATRRLVGPLNVAGGGRRGRGQGRGMGRRDGPLPRCHRWGVFYVNMAAPGLLLRPLCVNTIRSACGGKECGGVVGSCVSRVCVRRREAQGVRKPSERACTV